MDFSHTNNKKTGDDVWLRRVCVDARYTQHLNFLLYVFLIGSVFIVYSNVYSNPFLYDDQSLIVHNQFLRSWSYLRTLFVTSLTAGSKLSNSYYRPLQTLTYMGIFQVSGLSLFAFHFLNVALHAVNTCLVYKLGTKLNFKLSASFFAALLWALHPLQTEAVTYMSATADELYSLFCLLGVIILLPDFTSRRILGATLLMILGFLSKESAIAFPLLAMSCLYLLSAKRFDLKIYIRFWPLILITVIYVILHYVFFPQHGVMPNSGPSPNLVNFAPLTALLRYMALLFVPIHLYLGHELPIYTTVWHASVLGGIAVVVLGAFQVLREQPSYSLPISWGICWGAASLMPSFPTSVVFYEHWMYLASAGLFLGLAQTLALSVECRPLLKSKGAHKIFVMAMSAIIMGAAFLSYKQNLVWREPIVFYNNIISQSQYAANAHVNLGMIYLESGDYEDAIKQNQIAIEKSEDTIPAAETNLAIAELLLPDQKVHAEEGLIHLRRALDLDPEFYSALEALALFYNQQGDTAQAKIYRDKADAIHAKFLSSP